MQQKKKFISIIWGYHGQIFSFEKEQNYHMMPLEIMSQLNYTCEIFSIDSRVRIEDDPNFIPQVRVIYYKNPFQYFLYLLKNRRNIIYSNSLTLKTLLVGIIGKKTLFMGHDQVLPSDSKYIKRMIVLFFYKFFSCIRTINIEEQNILNSQKIYSQMIPLVISPHFLRGFLSEPRKGATFIGNLSPDKRPEILIELGRKFKENTIDFVLQVVGEDRYKDAEGNTFSDCVRKYGLESYIHILGYKNTQEIQDILSKSLIYINTSLSEGQCIAVYEGALAGNFLCLPKIMSFPSVFKDNALYHTNVGELYENIKYYLENKESLSYFIQNNQKMILSDMNYETIKKKLSTLFTNI